MTQNPELPSQVAIYKKAEMGLRDITAFLNVQSIATRGLFILAVLYTLYFAQVLLVPIVFAFTFYYMLKPLVNYLYRKWYISKYLGAAVVLFFGFILIALGIFYLSAQAQAWIQNAPETLDKFNAKVSTLAGFLQKPMEIFGDLSQKVKESFHLSTEQPTQVSWIGLIFASTWEFLVQFSIFTVLLYFLLAAERSFLTKLVIIALPFEHKHEAFNVVQQIEGKIWSYLFARTVINVVYAFVLSIFFSAFGVPNPILWGVLTGILTYIPYIGQVIALVIITIISVVTFDTTWHMLSVPIIFFVLSNLEGNFITPYVMGKTFVLDPVEVVLSVFILGWIWGVIGAFLAIPIIITLKIILDNINEDNFMKTLSE